MITENFKIYSPRTQIVCTGFGPIGGSLSEAVGSKFANDSQMVVSLEGDGGFQMAAVELLTSFNYSKPILAIVLNNGVLGPVYNQQMKVYGKSFMSEFKGADYKKLSEGLKTEYVCIRENKGIDLLIKEALEKIKKGSSVLMEVVLNK